MLQCYQYKRMHSQMFGVFANLQLRILRWTRVPPVVQRNQCSAETFNEFGFSRPQFPCKFMEHNLFGQHVRFKLNFERFFELFT